MQENEPDREARLRELASKLFFTLESHDARLVLYRIPTFPGRFDMNV
jgi:hypothetical protein